MLDEACASLAVPHLYLNTGISRIVSQRNQLQKELKQWKHRYFDKVCKDVMETEDPCVSENMMNMMWMICGSWPR